MLLFSKSVWTSQLFRLGVGWERETRHAFHWFLSNSIAVGEVEYRNPKANSVNIDLQVWFKNRRAKARQQKKAQSNGIGSGGSSSGSSSGDGSTGGGTDEVTVSFPHFFPLGYLVRKKNWPVVYLWLPLFVFSQPVTLFPRAASMFVAHYRNGPSEQTVSSNNNLSE